MATAHLTAAPEQLASTSADAPVPYFVTEAGDRATASSAVDAGHRLVPALVGRRDSAQIVWVKCPTSWCIVDHAATRTGFVEDVNHQGASVALSITPNVGERVPIEVYLSEWPGSYSETRPRLAVDLDNDVALYDRTGALALADQMVAFAQDVRRLAETLPEGGA